jgi:hypothetical protein
VKIAVGTYTGNGSAGHAIAIVDELGANFQPDFVLIKGGSTNAVFSEATVAAMGADLTKQITGSVAPGSGLITALTSTGFTLGTNANVNANGVVYYYLAIKDTGSGDMHQASYLGNGSAGHQITGVGFQPDVVILLRGGAAPARWFSSTSTSTGSQGFNAAVAADLTSIDSDGFTLTTSGNTNNSGETYYYVAFKFTVGLFKAIHYTGNGSSQNVTGYGFQPDFVFSERQESASTSGFVATKDMPSTDSYRMDNSGTPATTEITAFVSDGFSVGAGTNTNTNTGLYNAIGFKVGTTSTGHGGRQELVNGGLVNRGLVNTGLVSTGE